MDDVLAHRVRRSLVPRGVGQGLLGRQDLDKTARKMVEFVRLRHVPVQGRRIKLRQQVDPLDPGVDAVGNRYVHEAVFAGQWHGRLRSLLGQRKQPRALPATQDKRYNTGGFDGGFFYNCHKTWLASAVHPFYLNARARASGIRKKQRSDLCVALSVTSANKRRLPSSWRDCAVWNTEAMIAPALPCSRTSSSIGSKRRAKSTTAWPANSGSSRSPAAWASATRAGQPTDRRPMRIPIPISTKAAGSPWCI